MIESGSLFGADVPAGFRYQANFVTIEDEEALVDEIGRVEFANFEMHGVVARRRVAFFGQSYDNAGHTTPPIPAFLMPLRHKVAGWVGVDADAFAMALINEYRPGAPIGWHRDAPQYDLVAGVSLLSSCSMRLRPYVSPKDVPTLERRRTTTHEITLEPRSVYLISGEARSRYEHHIPAATALRYSITFRTLR